jgi:hypothetical protein
MQENKLLENESLLKTVKTHNFCISVSKIFMTIFAIPMIIFLISIPLTIAHHSAIGATVTLGFISLFLLVPMSASIKRITQVTTITNNRVIVNYGWLNKTTIEIIPENRVNNSRTRLIW